MHNYLIDNCLHNQFLDFSNFCPKTSYFTSFILKVLEKSNGKTQNHIRNYLQFNDLHQFQRPAKTQKFLKIPSSTEWSVTPSPPSSYHNLPFRTDNPALSGNNAGVSENTLGLFAITLGVFVQKNRAQLVKVGPVFSLSLLKRIYQSSKSSSKSNSGLFPARLSVMLSHRGSPLRYKNQTKNQLPKNIPVSYLR